MWLVWCRCRIWSAAVAVILADVVVVVVVVVVVAAGVAIVLPDPQADTSALEKRWISRSGTSLCGLRSAVGYFAAVSSRRCYRSNTTEL